MKIRHSILAALVCAAAMNVQAAAPGVDASATTPAATAATGASAPAAKPAAHATARNMQLRNAKFSACRKDALDRGLSGEELKKALLDCMN